MRGPYLGDGVFVSEDVKEELGGGLSLAVCDRTVAVHHQILLNPGGQVLLPAGLEENNNIYKEPLVNLHTNLSGYYGSTFVLKKKMKQQKNISIRHYSCQTHPAAVVHAAEGGGGLRLPCVGDEAHGAAGDGAGG